MKKFAAVLASLLVLACGTTVLAAPSADAKAYADAVKVERTDVKLEKVEDAVVTSAQTEAKAKNASILALVDVTVEGTGSKTITFLVADVKAGDDIKVLHFNGTKWEEITKDLKVEDGKVTATFESLSPVAIVKVAAGEKAPTTGAPVVLPVVALICAAGAAGCAKKVKFN